MSQIPAEDIEEFRKLYKEEFNEDLTFEQACQMADRVIALYRIIMRPLANEGAASLSTPSLPGL